MKKLNSNIKRIKNVYTTIFPLLLSFPFLFSTNFLVPKERAPVSLCALIDQSLSITSKQQKIIKESLSGLIDRFLKKGDQVEIIGFGDKPHLITSQKIESPIDKQILKSIVKDIPTFSQKTTFSTALKKAGEDLSGKNSRKFTLLFSDLVPDPKNWSKQEEREKILRELRNLRENNVQTFLLSVTDPSQEFPLKETKKIGAILLNLQKTEDLSSIKKYINDEKINLSFLLFIGIIGTPGVLCYLFLRAKKPFNFILFIEEGNKEKKITLHPGEVEFEGKMKIEHTGKKINISIPKEETLTSKKYTLRGDGENITLRGKKISILKEEKNAKNMGRNW